VFVIEKNTVRNRYDTPGNKQTAFVAPRRFPIEVQKIEHGRCLPLQQHKGASLGCIVESIFVRHDTTSRAGSLMG